MARFAPVSRRLHPDFQQKPTGPVEIDWSNPLTREMWLYSPGNINLVTSRPATYGPSRREKYVPGLGLCDYFPGDTDTEYKDFPNSDVPSLTNKLTIAFWYVPDNDSLTSPHGTAAQTLIDATDGNSEGFRLFWNISGGLEFRFRLFADSAVNLDVAPTAFSAGEKLFMVFRYDGTNMEIFQNGVSLGSTGNTGNVTAIVDQIRVGNFISASVNRASHGVIEDLTILNRAWTQQEIYSVMRDPYQLLKPAVDNLYIIPSAGGGGPVTANYEPIFLYYRKLLAGGY